jgi:hypothetical protein
MVGGFSAVGVDMLVARRSDHVNKSSFSSPQTSPSSSQLDPQELDISWNSSEAAGSVHIHDPRNVDLSTLESTLYAIR